MAHVVAAPLIFAVAGAGWGRPSVTIGLTLAAVLLVSVAWYWRERLLNRLRFTIGQIYGLAELILTSTSPADLRRRLEDDLALILQPCVVTLFGRDAAGELAPLGGAAETPQTPAQRCISGGEIIRGVNPGPPQRPVLCFPMFAQNELAGVLQIVFAKSVPAIPRDALVALQHLANQAAMALKLLNQQLQREQVLRGEKLGAAGQLIAGISQELSGPLGALLEHARALRDGPSAAARQGLDAMAEEAGRAADTLARLVRIARGEQEKAQPVNLNELLAVLADVRGRRWRASSFEAAYAPAAEAIVVVGSRGQLEQAFVSLLAHAEQQLETAAEKCLQLAVRARAGRAIVEIVYSAPPRPVEAGSGEEGIWGIEVCRGIFANHGGGLHHGEAALGARFEVELPLSQSSSAPAAAQPAVSSGPPLTILLAEPDPQHHRRLLGRLAASHHRVVPAADANDALDRLPCLPFDLLIASAALPGLPWIELVERARRHVPRVLILTDPLEAGAPMSDPAVTLLPRNIRDEDLDRYLAATGPGAPAS